MDREPRPGWLQGQWILSIPTVAQLGTQGHLLRRLGLFTRGWGHSLSGDQASRVSRGSSAFPPEMTCKHSLEVRMRPPGSQPYVSREAVPVLTLVLPGQV